jgi:hypothetical protein
MDYFAVIRRFTAGNSEISRCNFAVSISTKRAILRHTAILSLLFFGKNSENSGTPTDQQGEIASLRSQ